MPCALRLLASGLALVAAACSGTDPASAPDAPPSIILLSLDTLRADHLSGYGYPRSTSPRLDDFSLSAVRFGAAHAQATGTVPNHLSLLASLNPPQLRNTRADGRNDAQPRTRLPLPGGLHGGRVVDVAGVSALEGFQGVSLRGSSAEEQATLRALGYVE